MEQVPGFFRTKTVDLKREALYAEVWAEPMATVARRYGISDVALAKLCRRIHVPAPSRGYWRQKQTGRIVAPPLLPPLRPGVKTVGTLTIRSRPDPAARHPDVVARQQFEARPENRIEVSGKLARPHPLVQQTATVFAERKPDEHGVLRPRRRDRCLDVRVTPGSRDRALRIIDALVNALDARGLPVSVDGTDPFTLSKTHVLCFGEKIQVWLDEEIRQVAHRPTPAERGRGPSLVPKWDYEPTGRLRLHLDPAAIDGARKRWSEGRRGKLEDLLNDFVVSLAVVADGKRTRTLYWQRWQQEKEARERKRLQAEKHRREEDERRQALERQAESWAKAQQLRAFIDEVERRANAEGTPLAPDGELGQWIAWARRHAGSLDPFVRPEAPKGPAAP